MAALVQSKVNSGTGTALFTATYSSAPTQGNLLVAVFTGAAVGAPSTTPWSASSDASSIGTSCSIRIYSKVAGASESSNVTWQWASAAAFDVTLYEFSPTSGMTWTGTILDVTASSVDAGATVTSLTTGTTATTANADEVAVGGVAIAAAPGATNTATNSFNVASSPAVPTRGRVAYKLLASTGTQETTLTWTTARRAAGAIATYKQTTAGVSQNSSFLMLL